MANGDDDHVPLLFRMATPQREQRSQLCRYDDDLDELLVLVSGRWTPAVDSPTGGRNTKKADVETGEDQKDRW